MGGDVDEHLLRKVGEGSRRRHMPPSDERRARFWSVWSMTKRGREHNDGKGMRRSRKKGVGTYWGELEEWRTTWPFGFAKKLATQQLFPFKATDM